MDGYSVQDAVLISNLLLDDLDRESDAYGPRGVGIPISDEELALQLQAEFSENLFRAGMDHAYARALHLMDMVAQDDHKAALTLACGRPIPAQTTAQRMLEHITPQFP
jgi:hypothetical protein